MTTQIVMTIHNNQKCLAKTDESCIHPAVCLFCLLAIAVSAYMRHYSWRLTALYMLQSSYSCSQSVYIYMTTWQDTALPVKLITTCWPYCYAVQKRGVSQK